MKKLAGVAMSRQYIWQLQHEAEGKCISCGEDAVRIRRCERHAQLYSEYQKRYKESHKTPHSIRRMKSYEFHGQSRTRLYYIWIQMRYRCYKPKCKIYRWYGGKGIRVCEEWFRSFLSFKSWALANGYAENLTIDRKDSSKDYSPSNCQWLTKSENSGKEKRARRSA